MDANDISVTSIMHYMNELCEIYEILHSANPPIVQRDIKPSNIMITNYEHIILLDFYATKYLTDITAPDTILLGTKGYAASEQYSFDSSTPQTDICAIGILLKELVESLPEPTDKFVGIINTCTQMNPADRYQSVTVLKQHFASSDKLTYSDSTRPFNLKSIIPPGYRTLTPWKIIVSSTIYLLILGISLTLEPKGTTDPALWLERFFCLMILLSIVFCSFDYCNVQRIFPLCRHKNPILRYVGIVLLDIIATIYFFIGYH